MARLGILVLHGMGKTKANYADDFFDDIRERLEPTHSGLAEMEPVYYQKILQDNEERYFRDVKRRLRWRSLREFMLFGFCDAASLESQKQGAASPYFQAQLIILNALKALWGRLDGSDRRLIIIAQSLGGQVISNYLWDAGLEGPARHGVWSVPQNFDSSEQEAFCRGKRTWRLFTTGCNIPLFVAGIDRAEIKPIGKLTPQFEWHNYYDKDDVLGWPLKDLSDAYASRITRDKAINSGFVAGLTPLSHKHYWQDRDFLRPLVTHIKHCV